MPGIHHNPIEEFYWEHVVPTIPDLLTIKPMELTVSSSLVSGWKTIDFMNYWEKRYEEEFHIKPLIFNKYKSRKVFKEKVEDSFYNQVPFWVKDFIDWVVTTQTSDQAKMEILPYKVNSFLSDKMSSKFKLSSPTDNTSKEITRIAEKGKLEFYGSGLNDEQLSKEEYFIGLKWREENLSKDSLDKIYKWQSAKFKDQPQLLEKFHRWRGEFKQLKDFNLMREFYILESKNMKKPIREVLKYYGVKAEHLFKDSEL